MRNDIAQALLLNVLNGSSFEDVDDARKYFQNMAKYKYDDYQQYSAGMRFIERFALWLNQFKDVDKAEALKLIRSKTLFNSGLSQIYLSGIAKKEQGNGRKSFERSDQFK